MPRAMVVTAPASGKLARPDAYQVAQSDDTGQFSMKGMNPGEFVVLAFEELAGNYRAPEFAKGMKKKAKRSSWKKEARRAGW